jgi:hypothetical protein
MNDKFKSLTIDLSDELMLKTVKFFAKTFKE